MKLSGMDALTYRDSETDKKAMGFYKRNKETLLEVRRIQKLAITRQEKDRLIAKLPAFK